MKLTRTGKIVFAVAIVVLSAALGYLIWRLNNESNLGPDDSQAGSSNNGACWDCCTASEFKYDSNGKKYCPGGSLCPTCKVTCGDGTTINKKCDMSDADACTRCYHAAPGGGEPVGDVECNVGSQCTNKCYWPEVAFCTADGKCTCNSGSDNDCEDENPKCAPSCPDGYQKCSGSDCGSDTKTAECSAKCDGCNNSYYVKITCSKIPSNVCDKGGSWKTKPAASIKHGDNVAFSATATDSDGIDTSSVKVTKNGTVMPKCSGNNKTDCYTVSESGTTATISGTLASPDSGNYTIAMDWKDKKGAGGADCALSTAFAVQVPETNPDWDITKNAVEQCIDENTENPKSQLTYTIAVKNTGDGSGNITRIEDVLDSKVLDSFVQTSSITGGGVYSSGKIVWDFSSTPVVITAGASKSYTYTLIVGKDNFGTYANEVTLTPEGSASISASANITADCEISEPPIVPQTGIFDNAVGRIIAGMVLLMFGVIVYRIPSMSLSIYVRNGKMHIRDKNISKIRERFEKRVANS